MNGESGTATHLLCIDDFDLAGFAGVAAAFGWQRYGYVVTPNADHIIRYTEDAGFRAVYAQASYALFDSRFLAHWLALVRRQRLRVCPGSDLTLHLLAREVQGGDRVVLVGGSGEQAGQLMRRFQLRNLVHIDPPMGFITDPVQTERCLRAVECASPFRYCFLAVGSPQQELLAYRLHGRGRARGLALCVGASINYLTGAERRAPLWMRRSGIEWLFRLLRDPARMARRYLVRGPRVFARLPKLRITVRRADAGRCAPLSGP